MNKTIFPSPKDYTALMAFYDAYLLLTAIKQD